MNGRGRTIGTGALALALLAGTAAAQQQDTQKSWEQQKHKQSEHQYTQQGQFGQQDQSGMQGGSLMVPVLRSADLALIQKETSDNKTVTLTLQNGQIVKADVDNKAIDPHCLKVQGNTIQVLDESKQNTIAQIELPSTIASSLRTEQRFGTTEMGPRDQWQQDRFRSERSMPSDQDRFRYEQRTYTERYPSDQDRFRYEQRTYTDRYPSDQDRFRYEQRSTYQDRSYTPADRDRLYYQERTSQSPDRFYSTERSYPGNQDRFSYERRTMGTTEFSTQRPVLGVMMVEADQNDLRQAGARGRFSEGILIEQVNPNLPADHAGVRSGDVIVSIDGRQPATAETLRDALARKEFNDTVRLTVLRDGRERTMNVNLFRPGVTTWQGGRTYNTGETQWEHRMPQQVPPEPDAPHVPSSSSNDRFNRAPDRDRNSYWYEPGNPR